MGTGVSEERISSLKMEVTLFSETSINITGHTVPISQKMATFTSGLFNDIV
jgi:hypothetical protein